jgi:hypothetical protein
MPVMPLACSLSVCTFVSLTLAAEPVVLLDQVGDDNGSSIDASNTLSSQIFGAQFEAYDIAAIDDFVNDAVTVTRVEAAISGWNGYQMVSGILGLQLSFYDTPGDAAVSLIGSVGQRFDGTPATSATWAGSSSDLVIVEGQWTLPEGTHHVALIPINEFSTNGQCGAAQSIRGDGLCWQANPNGGYGFGGLQEVMANVAYRVTGEPTQPDCADATGDGLVDVNDVLAVLESWGDCPASGGCSGDVTGDGLVDVNDILMVIADWGDCV